MHEVISLLYTHITPASPLLYIAMVKYKIIGVPHHIQLTSHIFHIPHYDRYVYDQVKFLLSPVIIYLVGVGRYIIGIGCLGGGASTPPCRYKI